MLKNGRGWISSILPGDEAISPDKEHFLFFFFSSSTKGLKIPKGQNQTNSALELFHKKKELNSVEPIKSSN